MSDSNGSGKIKWTFNDADNDFDFLAKNQTLVLTYNIKVSDNHGGSAIQTVKITVTGTDDKPVITATAVATVTEQANKTLSLSHGYGSYRAGIHRRRSGQHRPHRHRALGFGDGQHRRESSSATPS